jgi:hypothetical protein
MRCDQRGSILRISAKGDTFIAEINLPFRHMVASARH